MPLYRAVGVKTSLRLVDIASTVTSTPAKTRSKEATAVTAEVEHTIANSPALIESCISNDGSHGALSFIGPTHDYPVMIVHAGESSERSCKVNTQPAVKAALAKLEKVAKSFAARKPAQEYSGRTATRPMATDVDDASRTAAEPRLPSVESTPSASVNVPSQVEPFEADNSRMEQIKKLQQFLDKVDQTSVQLLTPKSLGIVIDLPNRLFFLSPIPGRRDNDIKIEVFFNGQLAHAQTLMARLHGNRKIVISGRRVGLLTQRPWIILPHGQELDGSLKPVRHVTNSAGGQERWSSLQDLLKAEAYHRGIDGKGDQPHSGGYLDALSACDLPDLSQHLHKANTARFGVIDIVITLSQGRRRHGGNDLWAFSPKRLQDERYKIEASQFQAEKDELLDTSDSFTQSPQTESSQAFTENGCSDMMIIDELQSMPSTPTPISVAGSSSTGKPSLSASAPRSRRPRSLYWLRPDVATKTAMKDVGSNTINATMIASYNGLGACQSPYIAADDAGPCPTVGVRSHSVTNTHSSPRKRICRSLGPRDVVCDAFAEQNPTNGSMASYNHSAPPTPPETEPTSPITVSSFLSGSISDTVTHASQSNGGNPSSSLGAVIDSNKDTLLMPPPSSLPKPTKKATKRKRVTAKTPTLRPAQNNQSPINHRYPDPCPQLHDQEFDWATPALSKDSVCTYAEPGILMTNRALAESGDLARTSDVSANAKVPKTSTARYAPPSPAGHVFRNIKSMRDGEFRETEVVLGIRYIVG